MRWRALAGAGRVGSRVVVSALRPYPGTVVICRKRMDFYREHIARFGEAHEKLQHRRGRFVGRYSDNDRWPTYIVWADSAATMAHELSHVVLHVFELAGIDPIAANGEPFCYLLSQLMTDAGYGR